MTAWFFLPSVPAVPGVPAGAGVVHGTFGKAGNFAGTRGNPLLAWERTGFRSWLIYDSRGATYGGVMTEGVFSRMFDLWDATRCGWP